MTLKLKKFVYLHISILFLLSLSACSYDKTVVTLGSEFDNTWDFNNSANFEFNEDLAEIKNGQAQLKPLDLEQSGDEFINGAHSGSRVFSNNLSIQTDSADNSAELSSAWTPKWDSLVGYWKMDEDWQDTSSNANHGSLTGTEIFSTDNSRIGSHAGEFNGSNAYMSAPDSPIYDLNQFSFLHWTKKTGDVLNSSHVFSTIVSKTNNNGSGHQVSFQSYILESTRRLQVRIGGGTSNTSICNSTTTLEDNKWFHTGVTVNLTPSGSQVIIYINGKMDSICNTAGSTIFPTTGPFNIGNWNTGSSNFGLFPGFIDDVSIFSDILTAGDFNLIYNRQKQRYASHYDSSIIDLGSNSSAWPNLSWVTSLPFGKELIGDFDNDGSPDNDSSLHYSKLSGDLSDQLTGYWSFNENSYNQTPNEIIDLSGNNFHGALNTSTVSNTTGRFNNSLTFSGTQDQWGKVLSTSELAINLTDDYTYSTWVKLPTQQLETSTSVNRIIYHSGPGSFNAISVWNTGGNVGKALFSAFDGTNNPNVTSTSIINDNRWHHIAVVKKGNQNTIFVDGMNEGSVTPNINSKILDSQFLFGANSANNNLTGQIDEVGFWSRGLNNQEVQQLYRRGANRVRLQVRSCIDISCNCKSYGIGGTANDCDGDAILNVDDKSDLHKAEFIGPGGDGTTSYSELYNRNSTDVIFNCVLNPGPCTQSEITFTGSSKPTGPEFLNIDYTQFINPSPNRYAQYRVYMEADNNTACDGKPCLPELTSVSLNPSSSITYASEYVEIRPNSPINFTRLVHITIDAESCATFRLARAGTQYYYNSGAWAEVTEEAHRSSASDIENHALQFASQYGPGDLEVIGYLKSNIDGSTQCRIDEIDVGFK